MSTSVHDPVAVDVRIDETNLHVMLDDGRAVSVPLMWFPRLAAADAAARAEWRLIGRGEGIHWREIDEDIAVAGLLIGR